MNGGDRVMIDPSDRKTFGGVIGEAHHGGLAEYCAVPAHHLVALPDDVSYDTAACLPVAYGTAWRMMMTIGKIKAGEKVLILGASGGVGTCCVQLAKLAGVDHLLNYKQDDFEVGIYSLWQAPSASLRSRYGCAVNFTGGDTWVKSLRTLHRGGRLLNGGAPAGYDPKEDLSFIRSYELQILGSNDWARDDLSSLLELGRAGKLTPFIDNIYALADVNEVFRQLEDRLVFGKVVVKP